ncbi:helix-turn-helix domain-containing protein [Salinispora pacifica]
MSNAELVQKLTLSAASVKTHVARIFAKLLPAGPGPGSRPLWFGCRRPMT